MAAEYYSTFSLRISEETHAKIKFISNQEKRSTNRQIALVLEQYIAQYEAAHGAIEVDPLA